MVAFTSDTQLFALAWREAGLELAVEAWWGREALSEGFELVAIAAAHGYANAFDAVAARMAHHSPAPPGASSRRATPQVQGIRPIAC